MTGHRITPLKLLRNIQRRLNVLRARHKGVTTEEGVYIAFQGKLHLAPDARVVLSRHASIFKEYQIEAGEAASILLGEGVHFREGARLYAGAHAHIVIEKGCYFNHDVSIVALQDVTIGSDSIFGPYCYISDNNHGIVKGSVIKSQAQQTAPVHVGAGAWLGIGATLLMGARVGEGAVIAARAVVTKHVPPDEIWGGIPARPIGRRTEDPR